MVSGLLAGVGDDRLDRRRTESKSLAPTWPFDVIQVRCQSVSSSKYASSRVAT